MKRLGRREGGSNTRVALAFFDAARLSRGCHTLEAKFDTIDGLGDFLGEARIILF